MKKIFSTIDISSIKGQSLFCWQNKHGNLLTVASSDNAVRIYSRRGDLIGNLSVAGPCNGLSWDKDGDMLAVVNDRSGIVLMWDSNTQRIIQIDSGFKDAASFVKWSKVGFEVAVGTQKGNLLLYNHRTSRKVPMMGKHSKRITCGDWSRDNLLALGSEDRTLSLSNAEGDLLRQVVLRDVPSSVMFSNMKTDDPHPEQTYADNAISAVIGEKTLFLLQLNDPDNPIELSFQQKYGRIVNYIWYGDGYILIGFSNGYVTGVSTHVKEIGQEIFQFYDHKDYLSGVAISTAFSKVASAGDNSVRLHQLSDMKDTHSVVQIDGETSLGQVHFSDDGQLLAIGTGRGVVHCYLTRLPILGCSTRHLTAYLTSLLEVTVQDMSLAGAGHRELSLYTSPAVVTAPVEPSFMGLGPYHLAVGMNNRAWIYPLNRASIRMSVDTQSVAVREYLGTVQDIRLNSAYAAALFEGKIQLHLINNQTGGQEHDSRLFPDKEQKKQKIVCLDLTQEFLIYGTDGGQICYFLLEDWSTVNEYKHVTGLQKVLADQVGCRLLFLDRASKAFVYNPVNDRLTEVVDCPPNPIGIMWDWSPLEKGTLCVWQENAVSTFVFSKDTIHGSKCAPVGSTKLPYGAYPLYLYAGQLHMLTGSGGQLQSALLASHPEPISRQHELSAAQLHDNIDKAIALCRFRDAWTFGAMIKDKAAWVKLGRQAMTNLDIDFAIRVYRHIADAGMVVELLKLRHLEDLHLKSGYLAMYLEDFDTAQDLFLNSSQPLAALEMRRDLMHWDGALQLAKALAASEIPFISKEYAQQLEFTGDYSAALAHFKKGVTKDPQHREHDEACAGGVARMSIRIGDVRTGVEMARRLPNRALKRDCATILESMKQWTEAAQLFEMGQFWDRAATAYIRAKNWLKVGELLPQVTAPKIHMQYAKAREADGRYKDAVAAFRTAKEWEHVIRIYLEHLRDPEEAMRVVQETHSIEGAKMIATFFRNLNDFGSAIQFLIMSNCTDEALQLALEHGHMEQFAQAIGDEASLEDYHSIAVHFENEKDHFMAGRFYLKSRNYDKAVKHLLLCSGTDQESDAIDLAIDAVGKANSSNLTNQLIDHLMGDTDGVPKDAKYLFRLYMALKQYRDAAKTAVIIAREEQNSGNYRVAHDVLFSMLRELRAQKIRIPLDMHNNLMLLHSYIIVKTHVKRGDHMRGARMLIRVANNISKFPAHVVPILTSTVIECHRAGLRNSAFGFAAMLMRNEYRNQIDVKYKKKIEQIVRKPDKTEEEEPMTPCPYCNAMLLETELSCAQCNNNIPYCIASGKHMVRSEFAVCPSCDFPALKSEFQPLLDTEPICPMCNTAVQPDAVRTVTSLDKYLFPDKDATE